jgi:hypothetical protein
LRKHFNIEIQTAQIATKGWNWGEADFQGLYRAVTIGSPFCFAAVVNFNE